MAEPESHLETHTTMKQKVQETAKTFTRTQGSTKITTTNYTLKFKNHKGAQQIPFGDNVFQPIEKGRAFHDKNMGPTMVSIQWTGDDIFFMSAKVDEQEQAIFHADGEKKGMPLPRHTIHESNDQNAEGNEVYTTVTDGKGRHNITFAINTPPDICDCSQFTLSELHNMSFLDEVQGLMGIHTLHYPDQNVTVVPPLLMNAQKVGRMTNEKTKMDFPVTYVTMKAYEKMITDTKTLEKYNEGLKLVFWTKGDAPSVSIQVTVQRTAKTTFTPNITTFSVEKDQEDTKIVDEDWEKVMDTFNEEFIKGLPQGSIDADTGDSFLNRLNMLQKYWDKFQRKQGFFEACAKEYNNHDDFSNCLQEKQEDPKNGPLYDALIIFFARVISHLSKHNPTYNFKSKRVPQKITKILPMVRFVDVLFHCVVEMHKNGKLDDNNIKAIITGLNSIPMDSDKSNDPIIYLMHMFTSAAWQNVASGIKSTLKGIPDQESQEASTDNVSQTSQDFFSGKSD